MREVATWFDFDGVICDSVGIKENMLATMLCHEFDLENYLTYLRNKRGESRLIKVTNLLSELGHELSENELAHFLHVYGVEITNKIAQREFSISLIMRRLLNILEKQQRLKIISAAPREEIILILEANNIEVASANIMGNENAKADHMDRLLHGYEAQDCVYIGDTFKDQKIALERGLNFIGFVKFKPIKTGWSAGTHIAEDYEELERLLINV
jgi:phosphoglycolate phosphatase-like HAD superfamily hydrolase